MERKQFNTDKTNRKQELTVLSIFTVFSLAMLVSAQLDGWHLFAKELILVTVVSGWGVFVKCHRGYAYRAKFFAVICWLNFGIYSFHSRNFTSMLSSMFVLIVLLGIFCITDIVWMGVFSTTIIFLYHMFTVHTADAADASSILRLVLHVISAYIISLVMWMTIRTKEAANEQLMENIRELENVEKSKDDFLVNISHEIRTPINAVCGMSEAVLQEKLPDSVRRDMIDIQTAGRNLLATVSNILDFSELESGRMELAEESYNITSTVTDIINMALTLENGRHLELIVDCDAGLPRNLVGDEQKIRRIIMNILENAIKFTKEGGIVLRIKSRKEAYGINLVVHVKDSGIGMSREDVEKVFGSFSQVNAGRNREEGGIGLGLAITQALVRKMGGFINVESTPGSGTEFQVTLPQKVLDDTPIVSIKNKGSLFAACYINMDKYEYSVVREGYERCIRHMAEQFGIMFRICRNFPELQRRMEHENYTHIFIGWEEYCEDKEFFERLAQELTVVLILDYGREIRVESGMMRIYKPFTVLSIAAVFNGQRVIQRENLHSDTRYRFTAPEAKILVVDDNAMNLRVMVRLLTPYRIQVVTAESGREALEKINSMEYDCVYLDHMMPEMDGVETLRRIRRKPGTYFQNVPVIAFTANAIGGAREMFMAEGFNDFIAKPIELSVLERMLRRYIPEQKQVEAETAANTSDSGQDSQGSVRKEQEQGAGMPVGHAVGEGQGMLPTSEKEAMEALEQAGIHVEHGLTYCGDQDGFREITAMYHAQGADRNDKLEQLFREQDWKNYTIAVHALKGNSKGIGADELAGMALELEMAGKENRIEYILEHHRELIRRHTRLLDVIARNAFIYPEGYSAQNTDSGGLEQTEAEMPRCQEASREIDREFLAGQLALVREKIENFESEDLEEILGQIQDGTYLGQDLRGMTEEIKKCAEEFDFLRASGILDEWEKKVAEGV